MKLLASMLLCSSINVSVWAMRESAQPGCSFFDVEEIECNHKNFDVYPDSLKKDLCVLTSNINRNHNHIHTVRPCEFKSTKGCHKQQGLELEYRPGDGSCKVSWKETPSRSVNQLNDVALKRQRRPH